ncbi:MAG TPA: phenylacetate--CoA ligase [Chroococcales cyanobacterium]
MRCAFVAIQSEVFMWNSQVECLAREELEQLQLARLKAMVAYVYERVPFYRNSFEARGLAPASLKTLKDIRHLPFTRKSDLRDNYPFGLFALPLEKVARLHASSGTKGKPTVVGYSKGDLDVWAEICARSLAAAGVRPGDVLHNSYGYGLFTGGMGVHYGAERLGATVVPASGGRTQQQILLLQDFQARVLCSTPSYALNIAYTLDELKISRSSLNLQIGIFGAEPWTEEFRAQIESKLKITALDIYGLSEVMGPGVSMECANGANGSNGSNGSNQSNQSHGSDKASQSRRSGGLHIWEDHFLPEIVDPETGEPLEPGAEGELVITTLTKEAIPVIRYRTGDISSLHLDKCPCGRTMVRMARVRARLDDMLIVRGVNLYPSEVEKALLQIEELAPHYQLVLSRERALDILKIEVEVTDQLVARWGKFEDGHIELNKLTGKIQSILKDNMGLSAKVDLLKPGSIPRSEGKAVRVVDRRADQRQEGKPVA